MPLIKYLIACTIGLTLGAYLASPLPERRHDYLTELTYSQVWGWCNEIWNNLSTQLLECETPQEVSKAGLERVQNRCAQAAPLWHVEYFELKAM